MKNISEEQEERPSLTFNASFDPSNPLEFLKEVFGFIGKESDFLWKETVHKEIATAVTAIKKRLREAEKTEEDEESTFGGVNVTLGKVPNKGNGLDLENYSWVQNSHEVKITIPVPSGTTAQSVTCEIEAYRMKVCLGGVHTIIDKAFFNAVEPNESVWIVEDEKVISVFLTKQNVYEWWKYCMKGEPEIDTRKLNRGSSSNLAEDLDPETRSTVEKMMLDRKKGTQKQRFVRRRFE